MSIIYGVDTTKEVTPEMVKNAIIDCFCVAHSEQTGLDDNYSSANESEVVRSYCTSIVKKAFIETGGDFEHPTKSALFAALPWLANFSKSFRVQSVIQKHMNDIQQLIALLKE